MKNCAICAAVFGAAIFVAACTPDAPSPEPSLSSDAGPALAIRAVDPALTWGPCPELFPGECSIAVLHGDPSAPNADVFFQVAPQYQIPAHWHTSAERMILVTGEMLVTYQGQPASTLSVGGYAYGPAGLPHSASCVSAEPCTLFIAFEAPVDAHLFDGSLD